MVPPQELPAATIAHIAKQLSLPIGSILATVALLDEGGTVPFIARYRKEATGNLDEIAIGAIQGKLEYFRELEGRRATILNSIGEQGKLAPELKAKIEAALEKSELEDLYLPFRPKRRTKATIAREKGLEPLAAYLWNQQTVRPLMAMAATFVDPSRGVGSVSEALEGARHIVAEQINETAEFRSHMRQMMMAEGRVISKRVEGAIDADGKFKMYYEYSEAAAKIPSHRMLAIRRGSEEGVLHSQIELDSVSPGSISDAQGDP